MMRHRAASSHAACGCAAAAPLPLMMMRSLFRSTRNFIQLDAAPATSRRTAAIAATASGDMSGSRPGMEFWMRPSRYSAAWTHACAWLGIAGSSFSSISCEPPRSRRATSRKNRSTNGARAGRMHSTSIRGRSKLRHAAFNLSISSSFSGIGWHTSRRIFAWFMMIFRAASTRACLKCAVATPASPPPA